MAHEGLHVGQGADWLTANPTPDPMIAIEGFVTRENPFDPEMTGAQDPDEAITLEQAIAIEPSYEVAHLHLSRLFLEAGDVTRALGVLTSFLAEHPDSPGACQQTMLLLHQLGRDDAAAQMGEQTVRLLEARCLEREAAKVKRLLAGFQPAATPPERR